MRIGYAVLITTACGRIGFDAGDDSDMGDASMFVCAKPSQHDEDLDGVDDACDVCPHIVDSQQLDLDSDGVGDACDPEPANPRQRIALFASMRPGDQPFTPITIGSTWTQLADSYSNDGGGYGGIYGDVVVANTVLAMGFTITGQTNGPDVQHQAAIYPLFSSSFIEVGFNGTGMNNVPDASIAYWNGTTFPDYVAMPTASGIHSGKMTIAGTYIAGASVVVDAGWPGEPYHVELVPTANYQGGTHVQLDSNNVALAIEWVCVIAW